MKQKIYEQFVKLAIAVREIDEEHRKTLNEKYKLLNDSLLWQFACNNRIQSVVAHSLIDVLGRDNVPTHWVKAHDENSNRISAYLAELERIAVLLKDVGVIIILIENAAIIKYFNLCPGCFDFGDLDLFVQRKDLPVIHKILSRQGYKFKLAVNNMSLDMPDFYNGRVEYITVLANNYPLRINLQCSLVARRWFSGEREPNFDELFSRSVIILGSAIRVLCPEDNLFQLAIHNASHSYIRKPGIRLHLDIELFLRRASINWENFFEIAKCFHSRTIIYFSLAIPNALFGTPIPDEVLVRLKPPAWKMKLISGWLKKAGLFNPDERKFGKLRYILFNILLYDDFNGLWKAVFPEKKWMKERYGFKNNLLLPAYYIDRLKDLLFRRIF